VISRAGRWFFWPAYAAVAVAGALIVGVVTHFAVEYALVSRDQGTAVSIEESFARVDARCGIANEFALPALVLALGAFAFLAFMIKKYFAPRLFA